MPVIPGGGAVTWPTDPWRAGSNADMNATMEDASEAGSSETLRALTYSSVEWNLEDKLPMRFQLQRHKFICNPKQKGV